MSTHVSKLVSIKYFHPPIFSGTAHAFYSISLSPFSSLSKSRPDRYQDNLGAQKISNDSRHNTQKLTAIRRFKRKIIYVNPCIYSTIEQILGKKNAQLTVRAITIGFAIFAKDL